MATKRINSKAKGAGFEGTIAKKLSTVLAPMTFMRTPGSGARLGGKNFEAFGAMFGEDAKKLFIGDVVPTNERDIKQEFLLSVECKSYKESDSFETMVAGNSTIFAWMKESIIDADKTGKNPIIIFKWNRTSTYVGVLRDKSPGNPRLTLEQGDLRIDIFYLDELLQNRSFWIKDGVSNE